MMPRLSQSKPGPQRLRVPEGMQIKWVPKNQAPAPSSPSSKVTSDDPIDGVTRAQLHDQAMRLADERPSPSAAGDLTSQDRTYLDEQRRRYEQPKD